MARHNFDVDSLHFWSSITSFLTLAQMKGQFISKQFSISESKFLDYGFNQIINFIL